MKSKRRNTILTVILAFAFGLVAITAAALGILQIRTNTILDDYSPVYKNEKY